jgi:23S rRNA pseudouridine1911/1915/1917 synthase
MLHSASMEKSVGTHSPSPCDRSQAGSSAGATITDSAAFLPACLTVSGDPIRLDRFLLARGPAAGLGRRRLGALITSGGVRVNGAPARKGTIVRAGDTITLAGWPREAASPPPPMPLIVLYSDDDLIAVDKPPGVPATIGPTPGPSLASALLARFPEMAALDGTRHAGLVHRLDTGTSGLLLAARHPIAYTRLRDAFTSKAVQKDYIAVVGGRIENPQEVAVPLARHRRSRGRMVAEPAATRGWPARTEVLPIGGDGDLTVVRLRMRTGVTHQLRVHLALLGHPIVGDLRYGTRKVDRRIGMPIPAWHFLHARAIDFDDPALPRGLATTFPDHWRPFFAARHWSTEVGV